MNAVTAAPNVLLIDDERLAGEFVTHLLEGESDLRLAFEQDAHACVELVRRLRPTVVLVDLRMHEIDGLEVIRRLRADPEARDLPIVLLSSEDDPEVKARAFALGANDYLVKWPARPELAARIRYHAQAFLARRQRDEAFESLRRSREELLQRTRELEQSQAALHQAQKMEALGQLTGGVAHDFNNVLQIISSNLELMRLYADDQPQLRARIDAATTGVERGARLASHLLAFARRQPLQPEVIDLRRVMERMSELLRRALGDLIVVDTRIDHRLWNVTVDPGQFENVILNLAINARDAMDGGGILRIEAVNEPAHPSPQRPGLAAGRDHVVIEISDTGSGMSPEVVERAFDPFFTTKPVGQGTGLGLSMAYGFVKQSGGAIYLDSRMGAGTTVRIYLPRTAAAAAAEEGRTSGVIRRGGETILVVEDEPEVRAATVALLSNLGYRTLEADSARPALEILEREERVDLLFTDVMMPGGMPTALFIDKSRHAQPALKVLMTSGFFDEAMPQVGELDVEAQLLRKPYTADALSQAIRQLL